MRRKPRDADVHEVSERDKHLVEPMSPLTSKSIVQDGLHGDTYENFQKCLSSFDRHLVPSTT